MIFANHNNPKAICFFLLTALFIFLSCFVLASSTDGTIDSTYKHAWSENTGWINFNADNGNAHITDSSLSGSTLSETIGWINLDNISNDGEGNLTGYGWNENTGWINFAPTNGGVVINSSGEFTGSALSETIGWIIFDGDYTVKTDWRPQSVRPACNNALDDDNDGLIDYPQDLGCESLVDDNEVNPGRGLSPKASTPPTPPAPTFDAPQGFKISINKGNEYTNNREVILKLNGGDDVKRVAISNFLNFEGASQIPYQKEIEWDLSQTDGQKTVYAKFYTKYGQSSKAVSDTIILDTTPPEAPTILYPNNSSTIKIDNPTFKGTAEKNSQIILELSTDNSALIQTYINCGKTGNWHYTTSKSLADGNYQIKALAQDQAQNLSEIAVSNFSILTFVFPTEPTQEPTEPPEPTTPIIEPAKPSVEPVEPPATEPTQPILPIQPTEPIEPPEEPIIEEPQTLTEPPTQEPTEPLEEPAEPAVEPTAQQATQQKPLLNKISQKAKQAINSIIDKAKDIGKSFTDSLTTIIDRITPEPKQKTIQPQKKPAPQKPSAPPIGETQEPIPTPEPQDLLPETMIIKTAYGNINLTPDPIQDINKTQEETPKILGLSNQEVAIFVRSAKPAFGVLGQILLNGDISQTEPKNQSSPFSKGGSRGVSFLDILKPLPAFAQAQPNPKQQFGGGWKISEFSFFDEDNNGIYKAQTKFPANPSDYVMRALIAYKDGSIKTLDAPININSQGYVYRQTKEGMIRISNAKVALFQYIQSQNKYELLDSSPYNQKNPQTTGKDGIYSFLAPAGRYYIAVVADGYNTYKSKEFKIQDGEPINFNIELEKKIDWIKLIGFAVGIISLLAIGWYAKSKIKPTCPAPS